MTNKTQKMSRTGLERGTLNIVQLGTVNILSDGIKMKLFKRDPEKNRSVSLTVQNRRKR